MNFGLSKTKFIVKFHFYFGMFLNAKVVFFVPNIVNTVKILDIMGEKGGCFLT